MFTEFIKTATTGDSEEDRFAILQAFKVSKLKKNSYFVKEGETKETIEY